MSEIGKTATAFVNLINSYFFKKTQDWYRLAKRIVLNLLKTGFDSGKRSFSKLKLLTVC